MLGLKACRAVVPLACVLLTIGCSELHVPSRADSVAVAAAFADVVIAEQHGQTFDPARRVGAHDSWQEVISERWENVLPGVLEERPGLPSVVPETMQLSGDSARITATWSTCDRSAQPPSGWQFRSWRKDYHFVNRGGAWRYTRDTIVFRDAGWCVTDFVRDDSGPRR